MKVGDKYRSNYWGEMVVVAYDNSKNVEVVFTRTGNKYKAQKYAILKGLVVDVEESKRTTLQKEIDRKSKFLEDRSLAKARKEEGLRKKQEERDARRLGRTVWAYTVKLLYTYRKHVNTKARKLREKIWSARWYENNRGKAIERASLYQKINIERTRVRNRNRRARRDGAEGTHTIQELSDLRTSQNNRCACCGIELDDSAHVDHKIPLARGGSNYISNLQWLCAFCNVSKNASLPDEWVAYSSSYAFKKRRLERLSTEREDWKSIVQSMPLLAEFLPLECSELVQLP